jgi:hypothetical protein
LPSSSSRASSAARAASSASSASAASNSACSLRSYCSSSSFSSSKTCMKFLRFGREGSYSSVLFYAIWLMIFKYFW